MQQSCPIRQRDWHRHIMQNLDSSTRSSLKCFCNYGWVDAFCKQSVGCTKKATGNHHHRCRSISSFHILQQYQSLPFQGCNIPTCAAERSTSILADGCITDMLFNMVLPSLVMIVSPVFVSFDSQISTSASNLCPSESSCPCLSLVNRPQLRGAFLHSPGTQTRPHSIRDGFTDLATIPMNISALHTSCGDNVGCPYGHGLFLILPTSSARIWQNAAASLLN